MNRRDRFAAWFVALPRGKKFLFSLGIVVGTYLIVVPIYNVTVVKVLDRGPATVQTSCGGRPIEISRDDPIWDENDLQASVTRMCDRAWGRS